MHRSHGLRSEQGSLTMVILLSIVVAGLLVVMFAQVQTTQRTVRGDRDYNAAIQVADAGLQSAFTHITSADPATLPGVGSKLTSSDVEGDPSVSGGEFEWEAYRVTTRRWEIRSEGSFRDRTRTVEASFGPRPLFWTALYGHTGLTGNFPANTNANRPSWHSSVGITTGIGAFNSHTGQILTGDVPVVAGTSDAGRCGFNPSPSGLDRVMFGTGPLQGCDEKAEPLPEFPDLGQIAFDPGGVCDPATDVPNRETVYTNELVRGTIYCFDVWAIPSGHQVLVSGEGSERVEVYIRDTISMAGNGVSARKLINVSPTSGPPRASDLVIFFAGAGEKVETQNNNHVWFAAAIYAPKRTCQFGTQTILYGAAICNDINLHGGGGWNFHYDVTTQDIFQDEEIIIQGWREELGSTSGFSWGS
jgi:hypothetical protein